MNKKEIVKLAYAGEPERGFYLSDDFQWSDETGNPPIDKDSFLARGSLLLPALPDLALVVDDIREEGDGLVVTSHSIGTFKNDLDLSAMGMGIIRATGKAVVFPAQRDRVSFDGDRISELHNMETGPDAGMAGFFNALGADVG